MSQSIDHGRLLKCFSFEHCQIEISFLYEADVQWMVLLQLITILKYALGPFQDF